VVATHANNGWSELTRARALRVAGVVIVLLGAAAALLPAGKTISSDMVGGRLIAAGLIETVAGSLRRGTRRFVMAAGVVTALAGVLFVMNPETHFFPRVWPIIGWLLIRSLILGAATIETGGSVRLWTAFSAGMDFLLAVLLIAGLSISTLVIAVFGPTRELIATFAWVLAASFAVNGLMLLQVAHCAEDSAD
jgi:predicted membrane channel-forming protein YqfA (hemolysin III family)